MANIRKIIQNHIKKSKEIKEKNDEICHCPPADKTWHEVNEPKVGFSVDLEEQKVGYEQTMLVIGTLGAMFDWWSQLDTGLKSGSRLVCLIIV